MLVTHHICFSKIKSSTLLAYLVKNAIPFKDTNGLITFDICQDSIHWPVIERFTKISKVTVLSETKFSTTELKAAEWLSIRSQWRYGYPQPEGQFRYLEITYDGKSYCKECGSGLVQVNPFRMKNTPKWGNRHFMMLNWVNDELFVDDTVRNLFLTSRVSGCDFTSVCNSKGTAELLGCYQLSVLKKADLGFVANQISVQNEYTCPACGCMKYHPSGIGKYHFPKGVLDDMPDICKTAEYFGWGKGADSLILIRQKVYQLLVDNQLDRGLIFTPIEIVNE